MSRLTFRPATPADAPLFAAWDAEPHVRAAVSEDGSAGFDADWPEELADDRLAYVVACEGERPIGFLSLVDPAADPYWGDMPPGLRALDIIIGARDALGRGLGTEMMTWAIRRCFAEPAVEAILVDPLASNARAIRFYRRLGFCDLERRRFDEASDCLVLRLTRADWTARG